MNRVELSDRFAAMWRDTRTKAGKTQEYMAKALGVSKKTIQNWEAGTSCPTQIMGFEWFHFCGLQPLPYYLKLLYHDGFADVATYKNDKNLDEDLITLITALPPQYKRKLLYILSGKHGSSPMCILEVANAHLQAPLRGRINIAESVCTNYELAVDTGDIRNPDHIQPNMKLLKEAIVAAKKSLKERRTDYTSLI